MTVDTAPREAIKLAGKVAANFDPQAELWHARVRTERERVRTLQASLEERYEPWAHVHLKTSNERPIWMPTPSRIGSPRRSADARDRGGVRGVIA